MINPRFYCLKMNHSEENLSAEEIPCNENFWQKNHTEWLLMISLKIPKVFPENNLYNLSDTFPLNESNGHKKISKLFYLKWNGIFSGDGDQFDVVCTVILQWKESLLNEDYHMQHSKKFQNMKFNVTFILKILLLFTNRSN